MQEIGFFQWLQPPTTHKAYWLSSRYVRKLRIENNSPWLQEAAREKRAVIWHNRGWRRSFLNTPWLVFAHDTQSRLYGLTRIKCVSRVCVSRLTTGWYIYTCESLDDYAREHRFHFSSYGRSDKKLEKDSCCIAPPLFREIPPRYEGITINNRASEST